ncbi:MAG: flagellar biosynthesis protein FlhF [Methylocystaceae bacterium]
MKIRRYTADDFQTAMARAKMEMGKDAILLHTRQFKEGGFFGWFGKKRVEITVAVDEETRVSTDLKNSPVAVKEAIVEEPLPVSVDQGSDQNAMDEEDAPSPELMKEIAAVKDLVEDIRGKINDRDFQRNLSKVGRSMYQRMVAAGVEEKLAAKMIKIADEKAQDEGCELETAGYEIVIEYLKTPRPIEIKKKANRARCVMLIGPTGVGKTTTIAKLAANYGLLEGKKVALVTVDTYRIAAVEQLKTYAEIIGIPCEVVFNPTDIMKALDKHSHRDVVLIDTAGRSPRNEEQIAELTEFIKEGNPDEIILVLSATTRSEDIMEIYNRFNIFRVDKIIFTKLDETSNYGNILNAVHKTRTPLAYITNGQNVPDDIRVPDPAELARVILGEDVTR